MESVRVTSSEGEVILYTPERLVLGGGAVTLRETVRSLNAGGFSKITLDLSGTTYVDSAGIGELVVAFTTTANNGGTLKLNRLRNRVRDLLQITKLYTVFDVNDDNFDHLPQIEIEGADITPIKAAKALPFLLRLRDKRIQVELGIEDGVYKVRSDDGSEQPRVLLASPHILAPAKGTALSAVVDEFEDLINSSMTREGDIHRFLETHPHFLLAQDYRQLHSKVLLERDNDGPLIPDFLLQPFETELCDLVELKLPQEPVIVGRENRKRFSSAIQDAIAQLRTYRDYFEDRTRRDEVQRRYGIKAFRPRMAVVIGRMSSIDPIEYRRIIDGQREVKVITYDELLTKAKRFLVV
jgi:anti-anti-sigma factor